MSSADQVVASLQGLTSTSFASEAERAKARDALFNAYRNVQTPWDVVQDSVWSEPVTLAAVKTFIDLDIWKKWGTQGFKPAGSKELADLGGADHVFTTRLLRMLTVQHYVKEVGEDQYAPTDLSRALATHAFPSIFTYFYEVNQPTMANWASFAKDTKYQNPTNPAESNTAHWLKGTDFFQFLGQRPDVAKAFGDTMMTYSAAKTSWTDIYPTANILTNLKPGVPLVVDVGGNIGHDLEKFRKKYVNQTLPEGSLVLQDLPNVLEGAIVQKPAIVQGYDMFTPESVKGAHVYYLHCVLHDWPDVKAVEILKNLGAALTKGYSRILLHEIVIPATGASIRQAASDMTMMMCLSSGERTEAQWRALVDQAGLMISKIYSTPESSESIIEIQLP